MELSSKIYVAGHSGLVGSALRGILEQKGYKNLVLRTLDELDLTDQGAVDTFFKNEKPEYVFLAAALVGGIVANNTYRADFIYTNIIIQSNVIYASWKYGVKKLLFLGSTCIYPKDAPQPLKEEYLLTSQLEYTNEPYAIAKISGLKMCEAFNAQYKTNFIAVMPTNLYGPGDNFNLEKSHVMPALMRKIYLGKCLENDDWESIRKDLNKYPVEGVNGSGEKQTILNVLNKYGIRIAGTYSSEHISKEPGNEKAPSYNVSVNIWGTGSPLREFMHSHDMAAACVFLMENVNVSDIIKLHQSGHQQDYLPPHFINIGTGEEISIRDLAMVIKNITGFSGELVFDVTKPDGTMRKTTDTSILKQLGFRHKFDLNRGLIEAYANYLK